MAILAMATVCSSGAIITDAISPLEDAGKELDLDGRHGKVAATQISVANAGTGLDGSRRGSISGERKTASRSHVNLPGADRIFVLLVFIASIVAAAASIISMIIKTKRSNREGGIH